MDVQVIAQQWEFTYRYPTYGGVETPHLVLPAEHADPAARHLARRVHSFWAYQLGVKADANPGVDNVVYVQTKGPLHVRHPLRRALRALARLHVRHRPASSTQAAFATWIKQQQSYFAPVCAYLPPYATTYAPRPARRAG